MGRFRPEMIRIARQSRKKDGGKITMPGERPMAREDLSKLIGMSATTIWHWESGITDVGAKKLAEIADVLGVDVEVFFE